MPILNSFNASDLFNSYRDLTSKYDAYFQTSIIFAMFHLLRFRVLVEHYYVYFRDIYILYLVMYYLLLLAFMFFALYLYSFKTKIHGKTIEGNFFYRWLMAWIVAFPLAFIAGNIFAPISRKLTDSLTKS